MFSRDDMFSRERSNEKLCHAGQMENSHTWLRGFLNCRSVSVLTSGTPLQDKGINLTGDMIASVYTALHYFLIRLT
jgi:hypothetical protein